MIYFCIPAHNEERTVGVVLWKLRQVMAELNRDYQIIVVDDASTDNTPAVLSPYIRVLPLTVIRNSKRRGYADSLEVAIREAVRRAPYPKRDALITLQADFTEDPDVVPMLVKKIEAGADIVATTVEVDPSMPRGYRWGRKLFGWLLRGREWASFGDPLSGLRAYRVVTMKRALDGRGGGRLLSWNGWGANAELLSVTAPQSRRTDVVETALKYHRHQRDSRYSFREALREVRGAASGRANASAAALPTDGVIATPLPIVVEKPAAQDHTHVRGRGRARVRDNGRDAGRTRDRGPRPDRAAKPRRDKPARPAKPAAAAPVVPESAAVMPPAEAAEAKKKRRRRPRRRKDKAQQPKLTVEMTETPAESSNNEEAVPVEGAPRKKSRRGRRGGRGRRRGPRANNGGSDANSASEGGEASPPPMAAEGD